MVFGHVFGISYGRSMTGFDAAKFRDPAVVGGLFMTALQDPIANANGLNFLVTPESRGGWGDFQDVHRWTQEIEGLGWGDMPIRAVGDSEVAYMALHRGVPDEGVPPRGR